MPRAALSGVAALVLIFVAALTTGSGPAMQSGRQVDSATPQAPEPPSSSPSPVPTSPSVTTPAAPAPARRPPAQAPAILASPSGAWLSTLVSWYGYARPGACYGGHVPGFRQGPPAGDVWVANKTLPCGTLLELLGPGGSIAAEVRDRGPYVAGRDLDLSPAAFRAVVGSLGPGVARIRYRQTS